ncbi:hypothetical protein RRG08_042628 [Elysia crispata]|uniref:Dimethyladenosine transferase 2, mitochondrial n=1 Tax=Elysia crispata TaxID=231223 RepID=A0AAE0XQG9_9GAST|nr:hypothetical protein RRG08_042628 [Elysia crispata]
MLRSIATRLDLDLHLMRSVKKFLQSQLTYGQYHQYMRVFCLRRQCHFAKDVLGVSKSRQRYRDVRHVKDEETAAKLVQAILEHRKDPMAPVVHAEAGTGLVCQELLKKGVTSVIALYSTKKSMAEYERLEKEYGPDRFRSIQWSMLNLRLKLTNAGAGEGHGNNLYSRAEAFVAQLLHQKTRPGSCYALFNIGAKVKHEHYEFLFYILRNMPNDDPILSQPGVEFFFLAHPRFKSKIEFLANIEKATFSTHYSALLAAAYLLYDISFIAEFGANSFDPPFKTTKAVQDPDWVNPNLRLLVKMMLKKDIESILPLDHHVSFFMFLRQLYTKKTYRTIPTMEMLVPGCGLRMLALDFTMMDIILRTQPERLLLLYKHMVQWPEYQSSPLRNFILQKTRGGIDDWPESDIKEN